MSDFLKVEQNHGSGEKKNLNKSQLGALERMCNRFRNLINDNCTNYGLYRCTLSSDGDIIYAVLSGADYDGNLGELQFGYDMNTNETYSRKIKVKNPDVVGKALYEMILELTRIIPFSVGMLDFPIEGKFEKGFIMEYNKEPGTSLIIIKDSLDTSYFLG